MKFYSIDNAYIDFLKNFDNKVPNHSGQNYTYKKPYVGIVLDINGILFLAPLSSHKEKHDRIDDNSITAFKIRPLDNNQKNEHEKLGIISLANMIPITLGVINEIDFTKEETKYRSLLHKQLNYINKHEIEIKNKAERLFKHVHENPRRDGFICKISCNFPILIQNYISYEKK
ncbi:type III toxin-antitoxin system ToxN/AbiQ family toxin [Bombella apis]|uniref:Type III toxin-antitoxin system ToxN/AbiQ family toxin n=1 Tax=Bombella apis TaxID=1785988 RepID=A0ABR9MRT7_9PROT|nr:type III toxin-antitoxin system ToxN/AbiQ family toxin [Bombella apis]MBE1724582.1 type III toxin-antitoxin system ToxN/AbiQ family toxin [Bombella apis]